MPKKIHDLPGVPLGGWQSFGRIQLALLLPVSVHLRSLILLQIMVYFAR